MAKKESAFGFYWGEKGALNTIGQTLTAIVPPEKSRAGIHIIGSAPGFNGVIEGALDGENWFPVIPLGFGMAAAEGAPYGAVTNLPGALAAGRNGFFIDCALFWSVRFRVTAISSGSMDVVIGFGKSGTY